jgi:2-polyprenyl-6-methoxyphenol hydroxylase-like FAD-dependent oxidoreductase
MTVIIVGAGIGGLAAPLTLHEAGATAEIDEQARSLRERDVGINMPARTSLATVASMAGHAREQVNRISGTRPNAESGA